MPIPARVKELMSCSDKVLFTGTYDINELGYGDGQTLPVNLQVLPNSVNILNVPFELFEAFPDNSEKFLTETYNLTSWSTNLKEQFGFISFKNSFPSSGQVLAPVVIQLAVSGKFGIFRKVDKVIIDYTNPIRVIYFLMKEKH
jgi:hypothetical protein